ncbi:gamma-butyrobetaine hydroxylase-like domain-containing protein [Pseudomonas jinjuensis]|uniref:gamma-butyrobetaine hydroxylase-like domain-containing protein n=1 Tax=Pseudomonas jinjuensis TaxID=198616 RepID=UPI001FDF872E|nr:gamma-butyrobetaine hydroxylase-like domain-containing protein [Pseudomonas jinjuensis]
MKRSASFALHLNADRPARHRSSIGASLLANRDVIRHHIAGGHDRSPASWLLHGPASTCRSELAREQIPPRRYRDSCSYRHIAAPGVEAGHARAPEVRLRAIQPQGYGVQPVFSDGHDRGIYPWQYLCELAGG